jgi:ATP-dependent protease ClpP protease subunit
MSARKVNMSKSKMNAEKKNMQYDNALQIWDIQNGLLLEFGIDLIDRSFTLGSTVDDRSFHELDVKLGILERNLDEKGVSGPITIKLNNGGGDVYTAWAMVSRIKSSPCEITVKAHGHIMSAATMIFAAADHRETSKYCTFMFHDVSLGYEGTGKNLQNIASQLSKEEQMYCEFLSENTKKNSLFWKKVLGSKRDVFFTAQEAVDIGLADNIFDKQSNKQLSKQTNKKRRTK